MHKKIVVFLSFLLLCSCKIISKEKLAEREEAEKQDKAQVNVEKSWQKDIPNFAQDKALAFEEAMALKGLSDDKLDEYTSRNSLKAQRHIFIKDRAKILSLYTQKEDGSPRRDAYAALDFKPFDGKTDAELQLGSVFKGSALRDSLPFMRFENFANQIEYSRSSRELHGYVEADVTKTIRLELKAGQDIDILAVGILHFVDPLKLTPLKID